MEFVKETLGVRLRERVDLHLPCSRDMHAVRFAKHELKIDR